MPKKEKSENEPEVISPELLKQLNRRKLSIDKIYLDPNNPRFGELKEKKQSRFKEEAVQERALARLDDEIGIDDLIQSIQSNGFLPLDTIVVREIEPNSCVVVEGNRRVAAMKRLLEMESQGDVELSSEVKKSIREFEVLVYSGSDPDIAWRMQGLRHILGIKAWGPLQEAVALEKRLIQLRDAKKGRGRPPGIPAVAKAIGVSPGKAATLIRSLCGYRLAKEDAEYGDRIKESNFAVFNEAVFKREALQQWLGWDDETQVFTKKNNLTKLLGWMLPQKENGTEVPARIKRVNPDLRDTFPLIVQDPKLFTKFESGTLSIEEAQANLESEAARRVRKDLDSYLSALEELQQVVDTLPLPRISADGRVGDFREVLGRIKGSIDYQAKHLT